MRSIKRNLGLITLMLTLFLAGMFVLVYTIYTESSFYILNSDSADLGKVYDRNGDVLFDKNAVPDTYGYDHFTDVANFIGNDSGQMTNTLVSQNLTLLNNYSFSIGEKGKDGQSAIYTTIDHNANKRVYDSFGNKNGAAIAYNYKTGEILVCTSRPGLNPFGGYSELEEGSLLCKAFYKFVPGSTQKILTLIAARESMGEPLLESKQYNCDSVFHNTSGQPIYCHYTSGHGTQHIINAFANSCNPFFAQLVEDSDFNMELATTSLKKLGYSVNKSAPYKLEINNISVETASTTLTDKYDFSTQWGFIGQGETMISPCMLMMWQSAVANETGKSTLPYMIDHITDVNGTSEDMKKTDFSSQFFSGETASYVKNIMISNGERYNGSIPGYTLAIKSGTAQIKNGDEENSLLTGFDTNPEHPIAFCVLIEDRHPGDITTEHIVHTLLSALP
ncbi:MAG: ABC transporter permease [Ruminococcus sp.]|nr:ABC transporter permease [Ruminococcus sp.]